MLNEHLTMHIARCLPDLKKNLRIQMDIYRSDLKKYENDIDFDYNDEFWKHKAAVCLTIAFSNTFHYEVLGGDFDQVLSLQEYNTGSRMMYLFRDRYTEMLYGTEMTQESIMKREIGYAIQNILGVRTGLFTPDKAFDMVIRSQLDKLEEPTMTLLDIVYDHVVCGIKIALESLDKFPQLRRVVENRSIFLVGQAWDTTKDRVKSLLEYERAYINTKHEDFVGFNYAERKASCRVLKRRMPGQERLLRGYLTLVDGSFKSRRYFFVLTPDNLAWFNDESESQRQYIIPLDDNLKLKDLQKDNKFVIYHDRNMNVWKDKPRIELQAQDFANVEMWKKYLSQVGIFPDEETSIMLPHAPSTSEGILESNDPWLERQIESLWILVESYMNIVCKTLTDMVPKCIVHSLIKTTVKKFERDLVAEISRIQEIDELLEADEAEKIKRDNLQKSLIACEHAIEQLTVVKLPKVNIQEYDVPKRRPPTVTQQPSPNLKKCTSVPNLINTPIKPSIPPRPKPSLGSNNNSSNNSVRIRREVKKIDSSQRSQFYDKI